MRSDRATEELLLAGESGRWNSEVVDNPLSGERIRVLRRDGYPVDRLVWELMLAPGGRVPSRHAHPHQHERFAVVDGELEFRMARRRQRLGPGQAVTVPPGRVHYFANRGRVPARVLVETVPGLSMESLLRTAAAMAQEQDRAKRRRPRLVDLALFMTEFEAEVSSPWAPKVSGLASRTVGRLAALVGGDRRYRRLRDSCDGRNELPT